MYKKKLSFIGLLSALLLFPALTACNHADQVNGNEQTAQAPIHPPDATPTDASGVQPSASPSAVDDNSGNRDSQPASNSPAPSAQTGQTSSPAPSAASSEEAAVTIAAADTTPNAGKNETKPTPKPSASASHSTSETSVSVSPSMPEPSAQASQPTPDGKEQATPQPTTADDSSATATSDIQSSSVETETVAAAAKPTQIQIETGKMEDIVKQLQETLKTKAIPAVQKTGKAINDEWLSYEEGVRAKFPVLYARVEQYEQPIFEQSNINQPDLAQIKEDAANLLSKLGELKVAKEVKVNESEALKKAVVQYREYVDAQIAKLVQTTELFVEAVNDGDLDKAKARYAEARPYYERIEPIAETFHELDVSIDARINDVDDAAKWFGFHEIEQAMYEKNSLKGQKKYADQLSADVKELQTKVKTVELSPKIMVAGAMGLLNEGSSHKITGEEERYAHIDLVDLQANINGAEAVYQAALPALNEHNKDLSNEIYNQFQIVDIDLLQYKKTGQFISYTEFEKSKEDIRRLSNELEVLSNLMAKTAEIL